MSRLTNKNFIYCQGRMSGKTIFKQMFDKLYALEDLEDELGCPLEIISKILLGKLDEIIVNYGDGGYGSPYTEYITANVTSNIYHDIRKGIVIETNICEIPLKDYGVNWWLKGDKVNEL